MKRLENETFEDYKKRRLKDKLIKEILLGGTFVTETSGTKTYALSGYIRRKYDRLKNMGLV